MKKILAFIALALTTAACTNDDRYTWEDDFADRTATDTLRVGIVYNGSSVSVTGDEQGFVSVNGADVTVHSTTNRFLQLTLSGQTTDGSLLIYSWKKLGVVLNGVSITNTDGPAINNQCGKAFYMECVSGTQNTLADGASYSTQDYDQKGTLFSEGQIYFCGSGTLTVKGQCRNAIASDDYITIDDDIVINVYTAATGTNGIKANDGMFINGGTLNVDVASDGGRGIRCEARTTITGGMTTINTSGDCLIETTAEGIKDTTSTACIKSDSIFVMTGGTLKVTSTGDGGKGIRCDENIEFRGGTLVAKTTGDNVEGKPKAVKSDTAIIVSGGSFTATVSKSWACDNGTESENPTDHLTVLGTPVTKTITKRSVIITY